MATRTVKVDVKADVSDFNRAMLAAAASSKVFSGSLDSSRNQMSGLIQAGLALGPALIPITAAAIPAVSGLANQLAIAGAAAGVTALAFNGVGDALGALNKYRLDPTATNLDNLTDAMASISPAGREFVKFLQELRPEVERLQNITQEGMFPGIQQGLTELGENLPLIEEFFAALSQTTGDLFAEAGDNLNDPRWQEFFAWLNSEARPTLESMGRALGNFTEGLAQMWMAFEPLNDQWSASFLSMSRDFAEWASGLSKTAGFQDFIAYIQRVGPQVGETLGALGNALVEIAKAAAVVGDVALPILELLADALAGLMESPAGPALLGIAAGIAAVSTAMRIAKFGNFAAIGAGVKTLRDLAPALGAASSSWLAYDAAAGRAMGRQGPLTESMKRFGPTLGKAGAAAGGLALVMSDLDDKMGLTRTTSFALAGALVTGGPLGAAVGGAIGLTMDLANANDDLWAAIDRAAQAAGNSSVAYETQAAAIEAARKKIEELKQASGRGGDVSFMAGLKGIKNVTEGIFGKSDVEEAEAALRKLEKASQDQKFAEMGMSEVLDGASQKLRDHTEAIYDDIAAKRASVQATHSQIGGEIALEAAFDSATETIKENGRNINLATEAGRENVAGVYSIIDSWNALTPAGQKSRGGIDKWRNAVYEAARQAGFTKKEAEKLADELIDLGKLNPKPHVELTGEEAVKAAVRRIRKAVNSLANMGGPLGMVFGPLSQQADGSVLDFYANGGMRENHVAQIAPAGAWRVWAEPETGGEAYIPLAPQKRDHSLDIWAETGRRLGVHGFAMGGLFAPGATALRGDGAALPPINMPIYPQPGQSEQEIGRYAADRLLWALETS